MAGRGSAMTPWQGVGILVAISACAALLGALGHVPETWLRVSGAPVVLVGFALPLLQARSPRESSWLKLLVLATFASPPLGALVFGLARLGLPADQAMALTFAVPAVGSLLLIARSVRFERPGRALFVAAVAGGALAGYVGWRLGNGIEAVGFERIALAQAAQRSLPPTSPFLAGAPWPHAWFTEHLLAYVSRALALEPNQAFLMTILAFASVTPLALALTFAPLLGDGRAELAAMVGALLGPAVLGLEGNVVGVGEALTADASGSLALAWSIAAGLACSHALRHGRAPWVELCGAFLAFAFLAEPRVGATAIAAAGLAALLCPGRPEVRPRLLLALALATMPTLIVGRALGWGWSTGLAPGPEALTSIEWLLPSAVALGAAVAAWYVARTAWAEAGARALAAWLGLAAILGCLGTVVFDAPPGLGGGAAGGVIGAALVRWGRRARPAACAALVLALVLSSGGITTLARSRPQRALGLREEAGVLEFPTTDESSATERDVARALSWLARELPFRELDPILVVHPARPLAVDDRARFGDSAAAVTAVLTNLDLWCTLGPSGHGDRGGARLEGLLDLYETKDKVDRKLMRELDQIDRPAIVLVTRKDRWRFPWLENKFGPSGFGILKVIDSVGLFVWPAELAESVPEEERAFPEHHFPRGPSVLGREEER